MAAAPSSIVRSPTGASIIRLSSSASSGSPGNNSSDFARNSAFAYKGQHIDVPRVARELGVSHVLEGSVRKAGGRVRISGVVSQVRARHEGARFDSDVFLIADGVLPADPPAGTGDHRDPPLAYSSQDDSSQPCASTGAVASSGVFLVSKSALSIEAPTRSVNTMKSAIVQR